MEKWKFEYNAFIEKVVDIPVFFHPHHLTLLAPHWHPLLYHSKSGQLQAVWPITYARKWGLRIIRKPPLTPWLGPIIRYPEGATEAQRRQLQRKVLTHFARELPKVAYFSQSLHPGVEDWSPLHYAGYRQTTRYTYRLDLQRYPAELWQGFKSELRNRLRKGAQELRIQESHNIGRVYADWSATLQRQGVAAPISRQQLQQLADWRREGNSGMVLSAVPQAGDESRGHLVLVWDAKTAYALIICSAGGRASDSYTIPTLLWQGIQQAQRIGLSTFDFEGSMIPGVARLFATFGAQPVPYHFIYKYGNRLWQLADLLRNP